MRLTRVGISMALVVAAYAASPAATPYSAARPVLRQLAPPELKSADARSFAAWAKLADASIRARLHQGDLDSMVNLLLFGTSFTAQPRMTIENLAAETRAGLLRARLDDLLRATATPGSNDRLAFVKTLLPASNPAPFVLQNVQRALQEKIDLNARIAEAGTVASAFSTRGVSLDTTIFPNFAIDAALGELRDQGLINTATRVAILGPGLDFIDKESGFDYYPLQTLQPFAVLDSLRKRRLATSPQITILDISPRVLTHIVSLKARTTYTIQLPRSTESQWTTEASAYWRSFGPESVAPMATPAGVTGIETRAARFPMSTLNAVDLNIVTHQLALKPAEKFDLIVATNILVYYSPFEQALAMANIAAMLKPGGWLLTNDPLPQVPSVPLRLAGQNEVLYSQQPRVLDTVYWFRR